MANYGFDLNLKDKQSLSSKVFKYIRDGIIEGRYHTGEYLVETKLAEELGISRTPIREALKQLELEELAISIPNRGVVVQGLSEQDVEDIFAIRLILEGQAAFWAAQRIEQPEIDRLNELADLMELYTRRQDIVNLARLDTEFHEIIYEACNSRMLKHILASLHQNISRARKSSLNLPNRPEKSLEEHRGIMEAIGQHLPEEAKARMESHIRHAWHMEDEHESKEESTK